MAASNRALNYWVEHAIRQIEDQYGDLVGMAPRKLLHPGVNPDIASGTEETIWLQGGEETYVSANSIDTISSSNSGDTGDVVIQGHTVDGDGNFTRVEQTVTLTGQSKATLGTALARVDEIRNDSDTAWSGDVYVYEDGAITAGVPDTASTIHAKGDSGKNRSFKAAMTASMGEYLVFTDMFGTLARGNTSANVDLFLQIRKKGKIFITETQHTVASGGPFLLPFRPFLVVPANADVRINGTSDTAAAECEAGFQGFFAVT